MLFYRENGGCLDEEAKKSPLYMATFGKYKMRSNMLPSASARGLNIGLFSSFVCFYGDIV